MRQNIHSHTTNAAENDRSTVNKGENRLSGFNAQRFVDVKYNDPVIISTDERDKPKHKNAQNCRKTNKILHAASSAETSGENSWISLQCTTILNCRCFINAKHSCSLIGVAHSVSLGHKQAVEERRELVWSGFSSSLVHNDGIWPDRGITSTSGAG